VLFESATSRKISKNRLSLLLPRKMHRRVMKMQQPKGRKRNPPTATIQQVKTPQLRRRT
jgi:hypothetical protein